MGQGVYRLSIQRLSPDASLDGLPHSPREALHSPNLHTLSPNVTGYSAWHSPTSCGSGERTACCESGESITSSAPATYTRKLCAHPTSTRCWRMPQVVSCDIHRLRVRNRGQACRLRVRNRGEACQLRVTFRDELAALDTTQAHPHLLVRQPLLLQPLRRNRRGRHRFSRRTSVHFN